MKKLMLTNNAIARGAYEAGVKVVSSYPGTPSTEITEAIAEYKDIYSEWAPNEKVAVEVAAGASFAGVRSMACMKHVGLNVAADPLFTASYTGVNGGMVIVVADDPAMHSSQNEQDSRFYAESAHVPMLEPSNSNEAKEFVRIAYEMSEKYDTPVILRLTTRIAHSQSFVELTDKQLTPNKPYIKNVQKYVMMPGMAIKRHVIVEEREKQLSKDASSLSINQIEYRDKKLGIVTSGNVYQYVKEATNASILKLGMVYPLPIDLIKEFSQNVDELMIVEELEPFLEDRIKAKGIACHGKELFGKQGEYSVGLLKSKLYNIDAPKADLSIPNRPPVMCAGCSHRGVFYVLNKLKLAVTGDIGCYTLGALPPLNSIDACICMGASVTMNHGFDKAIGNSANMVSVIGDSTFVHSGITGLINSVYNQGKSTVIILDNSITGMTGHQQNPSTGKLLNGDATSKLNLEALCLACGVKSVRVVDAYDLSAVEKIVKEEIVKEEVSVIIARKPCVLLTKTYGAPYKISNCKKCKACLKIGCPAIEYIDDEIKINEELCTSCGVCATLCKFGCINKEVR